MAAGWVVTRGLSSECPAWSGWLVASDSMGGVRWGCQGLRLDFFRGLLPVFTTPGVPDRGMAIPPALVGGWDG